MGTSFSGHFKSAFFHLAAMALAVWPFGFAKGEAAALSDGLMDEALATIGLVLGEEPGPEDQAWLRTHWQGEAARQPEQTISGLEGFIVSAKELREGSDPMTSALLRGQFIDEAFCTATRSSDPDAQRLRAIFAPDRLVLAADCISGAVVTPFDVQALIASNVLVSEILGVPVDVGAMETEIMGALPEAFSSLPPDQQQRLLWGELRGAALGMLWSSVDEATREQLVLAAKQTFDEYGDVATTALIFEKTALKKIGEYRVFARAGDHAFGQTEMTAFIEFIAFVTDASFSPIERSEITALLIAEFQRNPEGMMKTAGNLRAWLDRGYHFGKDPATGRIRSWTAAEQVQMRHEEAALFYCGNDQSDEPLRHRLNELVYADNPVIEADCEANRLVRESDRLLAEANGRQLTRERLDAHRRAFELIFAFRLTAEERRWFDETSIADVESGSTGLTKALDDFQRLVGDIEAPTQVGPHLNEQRRERVAIEVYCINRDGHQHAVRLIEIINAHDPILFEDCARQKVVRQSDLDGLVSSVNFIAALGGHQPLSADEIDALPERLQREWAAREDGPTWFRSTHALFSYWWSRMPVEVRHQVAARVKQEVGDRGQLFTHRWTLGERADFEAAKLALCDFQTIKLAYETKRVGLASRAIINTNPMADSPWVNPEAIDDVTSAYGITAPFVQQQCGSVWN